MNNRPSIASLIGALEVANGAQAVRHENDISPLLDFNLYSRPVEYPVGPFWGSGQINGRKPSTKKELKQKKKKREIAERSRKINRRK